MNTRSNICLVGDILVDVTLESSGSHTKLRLGGIVHSARAFWALNIPYDVAYFAPSYLDDQIKTYLIHHGCVNIIKLGNVIGAPNVILIQEPKEAGDQGYEFLLRDALTIQYIAEGISQVKQNSYSNHLLISGNYDISMIANQLKSKVHVDVANNVRDIDSLKTFKRKIDTLFISTSSDIFKNSFNQNFLQFVGKFEGLADEIVLKENRGGSRSYNFSTSGLYHTNSQPRKISHSVGVGDVFDATYISGIFQEQVKKSVLSSWIAAEYAVTSFPDDFKTGVGRVLKSDINDLINMPGISLPWEKREHINIYIAAPDFTFVNTQPIEILESALRYHNFSPRRPIKENGQMEVGATKSQKQDLVTKDMQILDECSLLVAVLLYDDPGTLIEIGFAKAKGIPTIVYDPYGAATNCMLTELPDLVSSDLDEVITEIFTIAGNISSDGK